jgi:hypothetical protein
VYFVILLPTAICLGADSLSLNTKLMQMKFRILFLFVLQFLISEALMAQVTGQVIDARSRKPLDFVNVYYDGKNVGDQTDENGHFALKEDSTWTELTVSSMGYVTQTIKLTPENRRNLLIRLAPEPRTLHGVTISARRTRYSRKNNPAVDLMRRVIANKKSHDLRAQDYFSYSAYDKMTFSINEFTEKVFDLEEGRRWAFLKDHVEYNKKTGKLILPLTVDETLSSVYYRKDPKVEKTLIKAKNSRGINELINTGEILNTVLERRVYRGGYLRRGTSLAVLSPQEPHRELGHQLLSLLHSGYAGV